MVAPTAEERTASLSRTFLSVNSLVPNPLNPNEMSDQEFNMLYDNIGSIGITDPVLVRPLKDGSYRIVGGHHRWEVAKLMGLEQVPVTIITDLEFDDDKEKFQNVRHNLIRGKMSASKFMAMYQSLSEKYTEEVASELFGFTSEEEFRKMVKATGKSLPPEMLPAFEEATKEIKTIDGLALVLNKLFSEYGDTLPWGYMVFDFGGQEHVWIRMSKKEKMQFLVLCDWCKSKQRSVDQVLGSLLQLIATGNLSTSALEEYLKPLPPVVTPIGKLPVEQQLTV